MHFACHNENVTSIAFSRVSENVTSITPFWYQNGRARKVSERAERRTITTTALSPANSGSNYDRLLNAADRECPLLIGPKNKDEPLSLILQMRKLIII